MKYALVLMILVSGCHKRGHDRAAYVRDKSHHCAMSTRLEPASSKQGWDFSKEKPSDETITLEGMTFYSCDNSVHFYIEDNEEQP